LILDILKIPLYWKEEKMALSRKSVQIINILGLIVIQEPKNEDNKKFLVLFLLLSPFQVLKFFSVFFV